VVHIPTTALTYTHTNTYAHVNAHTQPQPELKAGSTCLAQFSLDKLWYRAYVERVHAAAAQYEVFFIDFGNRCGRVCVLCGQVRVCMWVHVWGSPHPVARLCGAHQILTLYI